MPRTGRGGTRVLTPGAVSANRTDLNERRPQAITAPVGGVYGSGVAAEDSQRAMPLPNSDQLPAAGGAGAGGGTPPSVAMGAPAPPPRPLPPGLGDPTRRPDQPVTAGVDMGPGAGSASLGLGTPDVGRLANYLPVLEVLASRPGTTQDMRNFVRLVRANAPTGA